MTGYGRGVAEDEGRRVGVEIRSVNHRFLDVKLRGAPLDPSLEEKVIARVRGACERGSVAVTIRMQERGTEAAMRVDLDAARRVHDELKALAKGLGLDRIESAGAPITLELLCAQPGVLVPRDEAPDIAAVWQCIEPALSSALAGLTAMRDTEGATLARDLTERRARLGELVEVIASGAATSPEEVHKRMRDRLERLRSKVASKGDLPELEESRLAQELIILADRTDVTEELVRLRSHLDQLGEIMARSEGPIGRQLDFLVQEIGREFNTVGSKSQSGEIARSVIEAKTELEKVREQVQNIE